MSQGSRMKEKEDQCPLLNTSKIVFNCLFSGLSLHKTGSSSWADVYSMCSTNVCFLSQCSLNASLKKKNQTHPSPHIVTLCVCVCVLVRTFKIYFLGKLQVYNLLLKTVIIILYIRPTAPVHLLSLSLYSLINISPSPLPLPPPSPWQPPLNHLSGSLRLTF